MRLAPLCWSAADGHVRLLLRMLTRVFGRLTIACSWVLCLVYAVCKTPVLRAALGPRVVQTDIQRTDRNGDGTFNFIDLLGYCLGDPCTTTLQTDNGKTFNTMVALDDFVSYANNCATHICRTHHLMRRV